MPTLKRYQHKRDFQKSPEPAGGAASGQGGSAKPGHRFTIQKHDASSLHYDLRLEMDGVLKSWAVPKGPSCDPADKRLAVHVEDHPLDYGDFEGIIPKNEYGGGTVMLWDRGSYTPIGDAEAGHAKGDLKFELAGERLVGRWVLVRMGGKAGGKSGGKDGKNWLLIKEKDDHVRRGKANQRWLKHQDASVTSGRTMQQIADDRAAVWSSDGKPSNDDPSPPDPAQLHGAKKAKLAKGYKPQLATLVKDTPTGDDWIHEIKFDGYRLIARKDGHDVRLLTRQGKDWTERFKAIAEAVTALPIKQAVIDGEAAVMDEHGISQFQLLQQALKAKGKGKDAGSSRGRICFYAFDLLYAEGRDLGGAGLLDRKAVLAGLLGTDDAGTLRYSEHVRGSGKAYRAQACRYELEGVVSKRVDSPYRPGRSGGSGAWVKSKCSRRQEFVIVGHTDPSGSRVGFGSLLLGIHDDAKLRYAGRVGTGFDDQMLKDLADRLTPLGRKTCPLDGDVPRREQREAHWVSPKFVAEIEFTQWTDDGMLRHPVFLGLREDKAAKDVVRERPADDQSDSPPISSETPMSASSSNGSKSADAASLTDRSADDVLARVRLTHPDRVLYPDQGITKRGLAEFYVAVADWMLPHLADRPLSLVRCPRGRAAKCFYQKHLDDSAPDALRRVEVPEDDGPATYAVVDDLAGLLGLVQMGVLEIHPWGSRADRPDAPDRLFFDLDPGPGAPWSQVIDATRLLKDALDHLGLESFCKLTGGKGVHVVVPVDRRIGWDDIKAFSRALADQLVAADPDHHTANMSKAKRSGKVYIDYLRNSRGATAVAPYSTRARPGAPVSTPIRWDELSPSLEPDHYTLTNLPARLTALSDDPWAGFFDVRQSITKPMKQAVGRRSV